MYTTPAIDEPHFDLDVTLGLFDGISCGQEALKRAGITTRIYLASEIEKYPKIITRKNHPLTVQLGDVRDVKGENLPKVDLILGGSPCQGFSFAGKQLNFDDPRSALFFEFVRVLEECREFNPDVKFLLENVIMKQEFKDIISKHLGVEPVMINSALVSAQNRKRLYWTNIPGVGQPGDKGILLKDVLEDGVDESFYPGKDLLDKYDGGSQLNPSYKSQANTVHKGDKSPTICAGTHGYAIGYIEQRPITQPEDKGTLLKDVLEDLPIEKPLERYMTGKFDGVSRLNKGIFNFTDKDKGLALTGLSAHGNKYLIDREPKVLIKEEWNPKQTKNYVQWDIHGKGHKSQDQRAYYEDGKHGALPAAGGQSKVKVMCGRVVGRKINPETGKRDDYNPDLKMEQRLEPRLDEKSGTLTTVTKDNVVVLNENQKRKIDKINTTTDKANCLTEAIGRGGSSSEFLTSVKKKTLALEAPTYRKLTCVECERLQTLPDNYTEGISNTQRYKALGNGWTIDVIVHILQGLKWQS